MPVKGNIVSTLKEEPYERLKKEAKNQRRTISDTLDIVLDFWDENHEQEIVKKVMNPLEKSDGGV